jgi:hypothetical protein
VTERRPILLTLVGWITVIGGLMQMLAGVLLLVLKDDAVRESSFSSDEITVLAIIALVAGLIYFLVGRGMLNLNAFALGLGVVVSAIALLGNLLYLFDNDAHAPIVINAALNFIVLFACLSGFAARDRFRR